MKNKKALTLSQWIYLHRMFHLFYFQDWFLHLPSKCDSCPLYNTYTMYIVQTLYIYILLRSAESKTECSLCCKKKGGEQLCWTRWICSKYFGSKANQRLW